MYKSGVLNETALKDTPKHQGGSIRPDGRWRFVWAGAWSDEGRVGPAWLVLFWEAPHSPLHPNQGSPWHRQVSPEPWRDVLRAATLEKMRICWRE